MRPLLQLCCTIGVLAQAAFANADRPLAGVPWPAVDGLDRSLPLVDEVGPPRHDRFVGIFYFLWHNEARQAGAIGKGPHDIHKILTRDPDALKKPQSPLWGGEGAAHYWGEPLYGYYRSTDSWVLRRHAHALADAGIDVLIFDTTNAVTYPEVYHKLCEVFLQVRAEGGATPQITFMVNTRAGETAQRIYEDLYKPGKHSSLWFRWKGKPLLICDPAQATAELQEFFTLRRAHWPFEMVNTDRAWHWEAAYPQPYGYVDNPQTPEQVNVSVAQNLRRSDGKVTNMSDGNARGRSFHHGQIDRSPDAINYGRNFEEQWTRARELDPPFVMITGWNEWIAGRFSRPGRPIVFVDQFDQEHSRDIEFARHGHFDHYYWQMVANIRRYKGAARLPQAGRPKTINLNGPMSQWDEGATTYVDHLYETLPRDHVGVGGTHYRNDSGRYDLAEMKVAADHAAVYFHLKTREPFSTSAYPSGLWLLIDVDQQHDTGWEGYDLLVGRRVSGDGTLSVESHRHDWEWTEIGSAAWAGAEQELHLAIPRDILGLPPQEPPRLDFKWVDNLQRPGDVLDLYLSGDAAPEGRFRYRFGQ